MVTQLNIDPKLARHCVDTVMMVRPAAFAYNPDAAESNEFMEAPDGVSRQKIRDNAIEEFDVLVKTLRKEGVNVVEFQDSIEPATPDSIFPNNWFDTDPDGMVLMYPMCPKSRRYEHEKGRVYLRALQTQHMYDLKKIVDLSPMELQGEFLEGTGSMVFDCVNKIVYACLSPRTSPKLLKEFEKITGYTTVSFTAHDTKGKEIYHTNVMMSVGSSFAIVCLESITDEVERNSVVESLNSTGHEIIDITLGQVGGFAGNVLQLRTVDGESVLAMSETARGAFTSEQIIQIEKHARIVSSPIPTIEKYGGGSVRCMLAEIFLQKRVHRSIR